MVAALFAFIIRLSETKYSLQRRVAGQGLVEYALILAFVAIVVVGILAAVGQTTCMLWYEKIYLELRMGDTSILPASNCQN